MWLAEISQNKKNKKKLTVRVLSKFIEHDVDWGLFIISKKFELSNNPINHIAYGFLCISNHLHEVEGPIA